MSEENERILKRKVTNVFKGKEGKRRNQSSALGGG